MQPEDINSVRLQKMSKLGRHLLSIPLTELDQKILAWIFVFFPPLHPAFKLCLTARMRRIIRRLPIIGSQMKSRRTPTPSAHFQCTTPSKLQMNLSDASKSLGCSVLSSMITSLWTRRRGPHILRWSRVGYFLDKGGRTRRTL